MSGSGIDSAAYPWKESNWLVIPGESQQGSLENLFRTRVAQRMQDGKYSADDVAYVEKMTLGLMERSLTVSDKRLEKLRTLCQLWDVDLREKEISSHRPFIGPVIVKAKRILFRLLKVLFKDMLRQQRVFNATVISLLADLANEDDSEVKETEKTH